MRSPRHATGLRLRGAVVHGDTVYLSGHVAAEPRGSVRGQTEAILASIDERLAAAGTNRANLLSAQIWLTDVATFDEMNAVWEAWIDPANPPARATVEA